MRTAPSSRGYSLAEVLVVTAIVSVVMIMAYTMIEDAARTSMFVEVRNELPVLAQGAANEIQAELFQSKMVFDSDATGIGPGYLGAVQLPASYPLLADSQMPLANATGDLVPDSTTRFAGNCILLARQLAPISVSIGAGQRLLADVYQFEFIYQTQQRDRGFSGKPYHIDLIRAKSAPVADYAQLKALTSTQSRAANTDLLAWVDPATGRTPITMAWDPGQPIGSAFYNVGSTGTYTAIRTPAIDLTYRYGTLLKGLTGGRISGAADYTVGFLPNATSKFPVRDNIPKYALFNAAAPMFPSGAEFLLVGATGQRRTLTRVVLFANYGAGKMTSKEVEVITATR